MAYASSYGVPLPPNGGGAPSPLPLHICRSFVAPTLLLCIVVRGLCRYGVPPPLSCSWPRARGACCCSGGNPPSPSWSGVSPPLPLLYAVRKKLTLLGGNPPLALLVRGYPPLPFLHAVHGERTLLGGCPPFNLFVKAPPYLPPSPAFYVRGAHSAIQGGPPPPPSPGCALG